ncbi:hypothetical protein FNQ90_12675 [Streptomyces alkaliphilus]|uniref:Uncharacterized protein n=1 Tax=Streptomyces alkaliphilus TaxID=1472722 RepID=A0A7W3TDZ2_9ACTN|nr:hypothetical protein [Streptomyces alkaliphilus]MBB0244937.1 hypothetical protein [Streptomyces alkaliphilus]
MTRDEDHGPVGDEIEEAEAVCDGLEDALRAHGITLPSLCVDAGPAAHTLASVAPPLVDLGRCNVETARALTAALAPGAASGAAR